MPSEYCLLVDRLHILNVLIIEKNQYVLHFRLAMQIRIFYAQEIKIFIYKKIICLFWLRPFGRPQYISPSHITEYCAVLRTFPLYLFSYPDSLLHSIAPRRSRRVPSRRSCRVDWASLSTDHSRRHAFSVMYALNTWRVVRGLARRLRRLSH